MQLLILGGTRFAGRQLTTIAMQNGDSVTLLHRGAHAEGLPDGVESVLGDRDPKAGDGLERLREMIEQGRRWDVVVDMCGYVPRVVRASTDLLAESCARYVFVSTVSVYQTNPTGSHDEDSPVAVLEDPTTESMAGGAYGGLKALCEDVVRERFVDRHSIVRPGLIIGPNDPTDRFTYWPRRVAEGGEVLVPDRQASVQWIDARDLADLLYLCVKGEVSGTLNAVGPERAVTFGWFLDAIARGVGAESVRWAERDDDWLESHGVSAWTDLPVYTGAADSSMARVDCSRALAAGLGLRSLEETARDTLAWDRERGSPPLKAGLAGEREAELLSG